MTQGLFVEEFTNGTIADTFCFCSSVSFDALTILPSSRITSSDLTSVTCMSIFFCQYTTPSESEILITEPSGIVTEVTFEKSIIKNIF